MALDFIEGCVVSGRYDMTYVKLSVRLDGGRFMSANVCDRATFTIAFVSSLMALRDITASIPHKPPIPPKPPISQNTPSSPPPPPS